MSIFNFEILKETEKAIFAKVPYFEITSENVKSHKQLFYECWIPKSVIEKGTAKAFVISQRNEKRISNPYQKRIIMPQSWNTLGDYAPKKTAQKIEVIDEDKLKLLVSSFEIKYGKSLRSLINGDEEVSDDDYKVMVQIGFPSIQKEFIPKKNLIIYK